MKFSLFGFPQLGSGDPDAYRRNPLLGNDPDQYAYMMEDLKLQAKFVEDAGFWGFYFAEHHFSVEGFEVSHNPLLLDIWIGMNTKRIKLGQLGLSLACWNPLRLAEDIATTAHMFGDRLELGFVRGFQSREVTPIAPKNVAGASSDRSEGDEANRRAFMESYQILMAALRNDFVSFDGEFYQIPPKNLVWENELTFVHGRGVTPQGIVTELGVVPKLPKRKMPVRWQAFSFSESTVRWAGREGMNLALGLVDPEQQRYFQTIFQEESAAAGHSRAFGEGVAYQRPFICLPDGDEARRYDAAACEGLYGRYYPWMFRELFRRPDDPPGPREYRYQDLVDSNFTLAGSPDEITRKIEDHLQGTSADHLLLLTWTGRVPRDVQMRSLETFAEKVMPRFDVERAPDPS